MFSKILMAIIGGLIILAFLYLYFANPGNLGVADKDLQDLTQKVGLLYELPPNETPKVATVSDKTKLLDQPFFQNAQEGDKVLLFYQAKKAILFRPSTNKIIEVAPLNVAENKSAVQATVAGAIKEDIPAVAKEAASPAEVILLNGASIAGIASQIEAEIKKDPVLAADFFVIKKDNAQKRDYSDSVVVVLNPAYKLQAQTMAQALNAKVGSLPNDETEPEAGDLLVILGKDQE